MPLRWTATNNERIAVFYIGLVKDMTYYDDDDNLIVFPPKADDNSFTH